MKKFKWELGQVVQYKVGRRKMVVIGIDARFNLLAYVCRWETLDGYEEGDFEEWELKGVK